MGAAVHSGFHVSRIRRWLHDNPIVPDDGQWSWITHIAMGVLMRVAGILLYLAVLVQQG